MRRHQRQKKLRRVETFRLFTKMGAQRIINGTPFMLKYRDFKGEAKVPGDKL